MANVWYIGSGNSRTIKGSGWPGGEVTWSRANFWAVDQSIFNTEQLEILDGDPGFLLNQDGPRIRPNAADPDVGTDAKYAQMALEARDQARAARDEAYEARDSIQDVAEDAAQVAADRLAVAADKAATDTAAGAAAGSATSAAGSATTATTKAGEAETARAASVAAKNAAETAKGQVDTAKTAVDTAKGQVDTAKTAAETAATNAAASKTAVDTAAAEVEADRAATVAAKTAAETAETNAETAQAAAAGSATTAAGHVTTAAGHVTTAAGHAAAADADRIAAESAAADAEAAKVDLDTAVATAAGHVTSAQGYASDAADSAAEAASYVGSVLDGAITTPKLADDAVTIDKVSPAIETSLGKADTAVQPAGLTKAAVGLGSVDNTADSAKPVSTAQQTAINARQLSSEKGQPNGYAPLDGSGLMPAVHLPSYVDDVLEFANLAGFPGTGEAGKIYVDLATNKTHRWSGSAYVEISASPGSTDAVTEGSTNKYYTDARARTAAVSQTITDGVTTSAPSQDAVFDALAGKAASSHTHPATAISDSTTTGRNLITAASASAARTGILAAGAHTAQSPTIWYGNQAELDALSTGVKNAVGFIGVVRP